MRAPARHFGRVRIYARERLTTARMGNPVLVEVFRAGLVESWHRGAVAVADADGAAALALGDVARPVFPRSAVKALQALPLVESGAASTVAAQPGWWVYVTTAAATGNGSSIKGS